MKRLPSSLLRSLNILAAIVDEQHLFATQCKGCLNLGEKFHIRFLCSNARGIKSLIAAPVSI
jgi:hypothetical protein